MAHVGSFPLEGEKMVGSVCVLIRKAPYGTEDAFAGLKLGLAAIANGITTTVVLMDDGVLCGVKGQNPSGIGMPSILDAMDDLISLDVSIYCVEEHVESRGATKDDLLEEMIYITEDELTDVILGCDVMTSF